MPIEFLRNSGSMLAKAEIKNSHFATGTMPADGALSQTTTQWSSSDVQRGISSNTCRNHCSACGMSVESASRLRPVKMRRCMSRKLWTAPQALSWQSCRTKRNCRLAKFCRKGPAPFERGKVCVVPLKGSSRVEKFWGRVVLGMIANPRLKLPHQLGPRLR